MSSEFVRDLFVAKKSEALQDLKITLCGGGGIAAIELPKVARELRRHGAQVRFIVTENCLRFVGKESLEWASEQTVIINPSGFAEHICHDDAVLVMPATANLLGKFAHGICDDGVTTLVQSALGHKVPLLICPTMHESLTNSPLVQENRAKLKTIPGIYFIAPRIEEGKEKSPTPENLVLEACHLINAHRFYGNREKPRIAVTYGGTRVALDDVRCLSNLSTGSLGRETIKYAYRRGLHVTAIEGNTTQPMSSLGFITIHKVPEYSDMLACLKTLSAKDFAGIFHVAAVSDYMPESKIAGKISSAENQLNLKLVPTQKLIELENLQDIPFKMGCKLTAEEVTGGTEIAKQFALKNNLNVVLWNHQKVLKEKEHCGVIISDLIRNKEPLFLNSKEEIARALIDLFILSRG